MVPNKQRFGGQKQPETVGVFFNIHRKRRHGYDEEKRVFGVKYGHEEHNQCIRNQVGIPEVNPDAITRKPNEQCSEKQQPAMFAEKSHYASLRSSFNLSCNSKANTMKMNVPITESNTMIMRFGLSFLSATTARSTTNLWLNLVLASDSACS